MKTLKYMIFAAAALAWLSACDKSEKIIYPEKETIPADWFAKGADTGWVTEMESAGVKFYNGGGIETECMALMKELGMNSIRLRAWVNPADGWCGTEDLLIKAWRAQQLGMRIMIDFHYSDIWADPGKQVKPAAWVGMSVDEMAAAISDYTTDVLQQLKAIGVTPEWVQVGNETTNGMLRHDSLEDAENGTVSAINGNLGPNYVKLSNAGYDAVKSVFPDAKVIAMIDRGANSAYTTNFFNKFTGGKMDVFGLSLYPTAATWKTMADNCIANMQSVVDTHGVEVMVCEVGMDWEDAEACEELLEYLIRGTRAIKNSAGKVMGTGVFYWEPEAYNGWKSYSKGAFTADGSPTVAMNAFGIDYTAGE